MRMITKKIRLKRILPIGIHVNRFNLLQFTKNVCSSFQSYQSIMKNDVTIARYVTIISAFTHVRTRKQLQPSRSCCRGYQDCRVREDRRGILRPTIFAAGSRYVMELRNSAHRPDGIGSPTAVYKFCEPRGIGFKGDSLNRI